MFYIIMRFFPTRKTNNRLKKNTALDLALLKWTLCLHGHWVTSSRAFHKVRSCPQSRQYIRRRINSRVDRKDTKLWFAMFYKSGSHFMCIWINQQILSMQWRLKLNNNGCINSSTWKMNPEYLRRVVMKISCLW